jgi:two-component system phosphate regulon response regulator PhoB
VLNYDFAVHFIKIVTKKNIIVVEDEPDILDVLCYNLKKEGFGVESSMNGSQGLALIQQTRPDLVLLDLMLPGMDGLEICRQLKQQKRTRQIPIIMVTAKGEESDVVLGLGIGADDYIAKPFSPKELVARVRAVIRRSEGNQPQTDVIQVDGLLIDADKHKVTLNDAEIKFTATEFRLLHFLASNPGRVFSRELLLDRAFGSDVVVVDRNVDVHIRAIRKKIDSKQDFIETVRGVGYRFRDMD